MVSHKISKCIRKLRRATMKDAVKPEAAPLPGVEVGKILLMPDGNHMVFWDIEKYSGIQFAQIMAALLGAVIREVEKEVPKKLIEIPRLAKIGPAGRQ